MIVNQQISGVTGANCYLVGDTDTRDGAVIDPADHAEIILKEAAACGLAIRKILLTHVHFDHIGALEALVEKTRAEVNVGRYDRAALRLPELNLSAAIGGVIRFEGDAVPLDDGSVVRVGSLSLRVLATPGHTPGSVCYISDAQRCVFSGDTLFAGTIGRTDFPGGDEQAIFRSLARLAAFDGDFAVYPGHGAATDIARERETNPYMPVKQ